MSREVHIHSLPYIQAHTLYLCAAWAAEATPVYVLAATGKYPTHPPTQSHGPPVAQGKRNKSFTENDRWVQVIDINCNSQISCPVKTGGYLRATVWTGAHPYLDRIRAKTAWSCARQHWLGGPPYTSACLNMCGLLFLNRCKERAWLALEAKPSGSCGGWTGTGWGRFLVEEQYFQMAEENTKWRRLASGGKSLN